MSKSSVDELQEAVDVKVLVPVMVATLGHTAEPQG